MGEKKASENFMMKLARFIVNKRKAFIALFILVCVYDCFETEDQKYGMAFFLDKNKEKVKEAFKNC